MLSLHHNISTPYGNTCTNLKIIRSLKFLPPHQMISKLFDRSASVYRKGFWDRTLDGANGSFRLHEQKSSGAGLYTHMESVSRRSQSRSSLEFEFRALDSDNVRARAVLSEVVSFPFIHFF